MSTPIPSFTTPTPRRKAGGAARRSPRRAFFGAALASGAALALAACETAQESSAAQRVQGGARPTSIAPNTSGASGSTGAAANTTATRGTPVSGNASAGAQGAPGASGAAGGQPGSTPTPPGGAEPERVQVQHILIGFRGSVPGKPITRTQEEARALAYDLLRQAEAGADFDALVRQHTDDSPPGIYGMANRGVRPNQGEFQRDGMVAAFGNVGFRLAVGGYGVADFDQRTSPYGYHVIKRVR